MHQKEPSTVTGSTMMSALPYPRCIALTQEHRGHGVSTAAYYLARALVDQGLRVLLADVSQRASPVARLVAHDPLKNLVFWTPPPTPPRELERLLQGISQRTAGFADVVLLDADATFLARAGGLDVGLHHIALFVDHTPHGRSEAERLVERLSGKLPVRGRIGVVFSRVEAPAAEVLPQRLESGVPVLGWLPADYLLAVGEAYSLKGGSPARPHDAYLQSLARLARALIALVPLQRGGARGRTA
jgi:hypothetical protein